MGSGKMHLFPLSSNCPRSPHLATHNYTRLYFLDRTPSKYNWTTRVPITMQSLGRTHTSLPAYRLSRRYGTEVSIWTWIRRFTCSYTTS